MFKNVGSHTRLFTTYSHCDSLLSIRFDIFSFESDMVDVVLSKRIFIKRAEVIRVAIKNGIIQKSRYEKKIFLLNVLF